MAQRQSVLSGCVVAALIVTLLISARTPSKSLEPPFGSIIPHGVKTAPTIINESSLTGKNLRGTYYTDNRIIAVHSRACEGKDITCGMSILVFANDYDSYTHFIKEARITTEIVLWTSREMFTYFAKQKPDDVLVYHLDILPNGEHEKG